MIRKKINNGGHFHYSAYFQNNNFLFRDLESERGVCYSKVTLRLIQAPPIFTS